MVPFESLGAVSYSHSIVKAVSVAVYETFSVKELCDLENRVRVRGRTDRQTEENLKFSGEGQCTVFQLRPSLLGMGTPTPSSRDLRSLDAAVTRA